MKDLVPGNGAGLVLLLCYSRGSAGRKFTTSSVRTGTLFSADLV